MILVVSAQRGYSDTYMFGPFKSLEEAKQEVTDGLDRGLDGDETSYNFYEVKDGETTELGYIKFFDECEIEDGDEIKFEWFK